MIIGLISYIQLKNTTKDFKVEEGKSTVASWSFSVPDDISTVKYRIVAVTDNFSDGEASVLPILSNRMLVTESLPMPVKGNESKTFKMDRLLKSAQSKSIKHHRFTVEFTSNPAWYALQATPYMMEYPYECIEQTFTRYYSNAIATHIMNKNPKMREVINRWGKESPDAFLSNLQKNEELKAVVLKETPWVLDAKNEEESKRNLAVLLNMNRMSHELNKAFSKVQNAQVSSGGWPWFPGMKESRYITQHIICGMGHLDHLGVNNVRYDYNQWAMLNKAVQYMDRQLYKDYLNAKRYDKLYWKHQHIGYDQIHYLYARSFFTDIGMNVAVQKAVEYYKRQARKYWKNFNIYAQGMIALSARRMEMSELAEKITVSLKDRAIKNDEMGMYWKENTGGYYWYEAPVETHALMIEVFNEITGDQESVDELKTWLLKQKQTNAWRTTKQTSEAVYALLLSGSDLLASDDLVEISIGGQAIEYVKKTTENDPYKVKAEAGTGYFKTTWQGKAVLPEMGSITVTKKNNGIAWGAAYWQYFEDLDKINSAETTISLQKELFKVVQTSNGEELNRIDEGNVLKVGDKVRCRIELRSDRRLEFVHMKDMRASGFEPLNVLSRYHYQDGLGYYQSTKDVATNFFFDAIPKGTFVFEYDLRVQQQGDFSNGITSLQCMYAPEFSSHSDGIRVKVE